MVIHPRVQQFLLPLMMAVAGLLATIYMQFMPSDELTVVVMFYPWSSTSDNFGAIASEGASILNAAHGGWAILVRMPDMAFEKRIRAHANVIGLLNGSGWSGCGLSEVEERRL